MASKFSSSPNPKKSSSVVVHDISDCLKPGLLRSVLTTILQYLFLLIYPTNSLSQHS